MKILKKDLKHGLITIKLENPDDVWNLENVVEPGDLVSGKTQRSTEIIREDVKKKGKKKTIFLKIRAEKVEFHEYTGKLRLSGKIIEGPEDILGSYHTLDGEVGKILTIEKKWKKWQLDKLEKSLRKQPVILVCILDEREANFAVLSERLKILSEISNPKAGKEFSQQDFKEYFGEIISFLKNKTDSVDNIIIAGPGFAKEDLFKIIKEKNSGLAEKIIIESCSHTGKTGIQEVIKRGAVERVAKESRISEETKLVENFLEELSKDSGLVTYGENEVKKAIEFGACEKLLICEKKLRDYEGMMELAEKNKAKVMVISEEHEAGQKLASLGGIVAFLRFKIS